jgi:hypothetical protein
LDEAVTGQDALATVGDEGFESCQNGLGDPQLTTTDSAKGGAIDSDLDIVMRNWPSLSSEQRQNIVSIIKGSHR